MQCTHLAMYRDMWSYFKFQWETCTRVLRLKQFNITVVDYGMCRRRRRNALKQCLNFCFWSCYSFGNTSGRFVLKCLTTQIMKTCVKSSMSCEKTCHALNSKTKIVSDTIEVIDI